MSTYYSEFCIKVVQLAMQDWRYHVSNHGLDLWDGGPPLLDPRFADARRVGRLAYTWDSMIQHFCKHKQIGNWRERAQNISFWMSQFDDFLSFTDT